MNNCYGKKRQTEIDYQAQGNGDPSMRRQEINLAEQSIRKAKMNY